IGLFNDACRLLGLQVGNTTAIGLELAVAKRAEAMYPAERAGGILGVGWEEAALLARLLLAPDPRLSIWSHELPTPRLEAAEKIAKAYMAGSPIPPLDLIDFV